MMISIVGDCDTRPVIYTLMKVCQSLGDVLLVTSNNRLLRLSDTRDAYGHYQNTMIGYTVDGIDTFWEECIYDISDYEYIIVDHMITADADATIYVRGLLESEEEKSDLEFIDHYEVLDLFAGNLVDRTTLFNCEEFEAYKDMCPINERLAKKLAEIISEPMGLTPDKFVKFAMVPTSTHPKALPPVKKPKNVGIFGGRRR